MINQKFLIYLSATVTSCITLCVTFERQKTEKKMTEKTKIFILTISGILFAYILYNSYHSDNLFQIFFYIILVGIGLYILFNGIFNDIEKYKKTKELESFYGTFIGTFLVILNFGIFSYYKIKLNSPTLLKAENHGVYADFKKNGEYIIKSGSWASKKYFYGEFYIKDSIITLDKKYFDNILVANRYVIRNIINAKGYDASGENKKYLIQVNQKGGEINNAFDYEFNPERKIYYSYKFEITVDNRNPNRTLSIIFVLKLRI